MRKQSYFDLASTLWAVVLVQDVDVVAVAETVSDKTATSRLSVPWTVWRSGALLWSALMAFCGLRRQTPKSRNCWTASARSQQEFRQVELDLQQTERDLLAKRDVIAKGIMTKWSQRFKSGSRMSKRYSI